MDSKKRELLVRVANELKALSEVVRDLAGSEADPFEEVTSLSSMLEGAASLIPTDLVPQPPPKAPSTVSELAPSAVEESVQAFERAESCRRVFVAWKRLYGSPDAEWLKKVLAG